jgi:DNA-directed RNA polymerase subunit alpha
MYNQLKLLRAKYLKMLKKLNDKIFIIDEMIKENVIKIDILDLSFRPYSSLKKAGINTIEDLTKYSFLQLRSMNNIGDKSCREIRDKLKNVLDIELKEQL